MAAAAGGHLDVVEILLGRGASPNAASADGETALGFAAAGDHLKVASLLVRFGADPRRRRAQAQPAGASRAQQGGAALAAAQGSGRPGSVKSLARKLKKR